MQLLLLNNIALHSEKKLSRVNVVCNQELVIIFTVFIEIVVKGQGVVCV